MNVLYRLTFGGMGIASIVYGGHGILNRHLTSGEGSWAKGPWQLSGDSAVVLGATFLLLGIYMVYIALTTK